MKQQKCKTEQEAIKLGEEWAKTEDYVSVIASKDGFYVENECNMIRNWERQVKVWESGV